ncbi:amino acid adenylation domain-containing protein [Pseudoalteromonas maricaloris]|uniref:amino acid adenylation domain-containing protein n=1 Tax=Pseudoalteromonas maricaloris TaxID=184924 RepID=UPI003C289EA5
MENVKTIIRELLQRDIIVSVNEGKLKLKAPKGALVPEIVDTIKQHKTALISYLEERSETVPEASETTSIAKIDRDNISELQLSSVQERFWVLDRKEGGSPEYNLPMVFRVEGKFDIDVAERAITRIISRHEPLRTVIVDNGNGPVQIVRDDFEFKCRCQDLSNLGQQEQDERVRQSIAEEYSQVFDLSRDLMLRLTHLNLSSEQGILLFNMHHIASDGGSMGLLVKEFCLQYQSVLSGQPDQLPPLEIQYADYAYWQRQELRNGAQQAQLDFWKKQLADAPLVHGLRLDYPRPEVNRHQGEVVTAELGSALSQRLHDIALENNVTLYMLLHSAIALVLSRFSHSTDIVIGTALANRMHTELEQMIGCFVNTAALRVDTNHTSYTDYLAHVRKVNLDAQANQDIPIEKLVEQLELPRSTQHTPLFQITFNISFNTDERGEVRLPGLHFSEMDVGQTSIRFDLNFRAQINNGLISFSLVYDRSLFKNESIKRLATSLHCLLENIAENPDSTLDALFTLPQAVREQLTYHSDKQEVAHRKQHYIHQLFEQHANCSPEETALIFRDESITYGQLESRANQLAHCLIKQGVKPDTLVGLCVDRSIEMVVGILGILKAGGAYVPLDPGYPDERLSCLFDDSKVEIVVTQPHLQSLLPAGGIHLLALDFSGPELQEQPTHAPIADEIGLEPTNLAYMIYTSGSSGQPKGVLVEHRQIADKVAVIAERYELTADDKMLLFASISFDASVTQLFAPLSVGGTVVVRPADITEPVEFMDYLCQHKVSLLHVVPQYLRLLLEDEMLPWEETQLRTMICGGDKLSRALVEQWHSTEFGREIKLFNSYGPTETTVTASVFEYTGDDFVESLPIGGALDNTRFYVVDEQLQLLPPGAVGELLIGGSAVARGYHNNKGLTEEKFISLSFGTSAERVYRTGDLVRMLPSGELEFIGRRDHQVKVRGFRIELGEIEAQLSACEGVANCAVLFKENQAGEQSLHAYVVLSSSTLSAVENDMQRQLPEYMLPSRYTELDELPVTVSGKLDRKALELSSEVMSSGPVAPRSDVEETLLEIWHELLDVEVIGVTDNFFKCGGHSLLATRLITKIRAAFDVEFTLKNLFEAPSIEEQALLIQPQCETQPTDDNEIAPKCGNTIELVARDNVLPLSFAQQRLWFLDRLENGTRTDYCIPAVLRVDGQFDVAVAEKAISRIIERHESLRTIFVEVDGNAQQIINHHSRFEIEKFDLHNLDADSQKNKVDQIVRDYQCRGFDLTTDLMVRTAFISLSEAAENQQGILLFNIHHIASDGWSTAILVKEFVGQYQAIQSNKSDPFPPLSVQYADYAYWQRQQLQGERLERRLAFWEDYLNGAPSCHRLPLDNPRTASEPKSGIVRGTLSAQLTTQVRALTNKHEVTLFMLLQTVLALHIGRFSHETDVVLGAPTAGRSVPEIEDMIGLFLNTQVFRTEFSDNPAFSSLLTRIKQSHLDCAKYNDTPFEAIVDRINPERDLLHTPLFQVLINLNNNETSQLELDGITFTDMNSGELENKYDLTLYIRESQQNGTECINLTWVYDARIFDSATMALFAEEFDALLENIVSNPQLPVLNYDWKNSVKPPRLIAPDYAKEKGAPSLCGLFEKWVQSVPECRALTVGDRDWSYSELNRQINQLASILISEYGVTVGSRVAIATERNEWRVISVMALLKAGGCYIPLSEELPQERMEYMLNNSEATLVLTDAKTMKRHPWLQNGAAHRCAIVLDSNEFGESLRCASEENPAPPVLDAQDVAHVIYTSGSTGNPKGVLGTYGATFNRVAWMLEALPFEVDEAVAHITSMAFIRGVWEMLVPLCGGARLVLCPRDKVRHVDQLWSLFGSEKITRVVMAPSLMKALSQYHESGGISSTSALRHWFVSGEPLSLTHAHRVLEQFPGVALYNLYGSTEVMSDVLWNEVSPEEQGIYARIGTSIEGVAVCATGPMGQFLPEGVVGELTVFGDAVAKGYIGASDVDNEKFVQTSSGRAYRTGDLGRICRDGAIEYQGRIDDQIKIRGYRVELGEVEQQILDSDLVASCRVFALGQHSEQLKLVAYLLPKEQLNQTNTELVEAVNHHLVKRLPDYMQPSAVVVLDDWPLRPNGKIDKQKLPEPNLISTEEKRVDAATNTEHRLLKIFATLLKLDADDISVTGNFFHMGGNSLSAVRLVGEIRTQLGYELSVKAVFEHPSIRGLAEEIALGAKLTERTSVVPINRTDKLLPLSFAQQRLWFIDRMQGGSPQYNIPLAMEVYGSLDLKLVEESIRCIIQRHESLRTVFTVHDDEPVQEIRESIEFKLEHYDLCGLEPEVKDRKVEQLIKEHSDKVFDLNNDLMLRAAYINLSISKTSPRGILLLTVHHIAADGWSMGLLVKEFSALYQAALNGEHNPLPRLPIQYVDFAVWQKSWQESEEFATQLNYWQQQLDEAPATHSLPLDYQRPSVKKHQADVVTSHLEPSVVRALQKVADDNGATSFMLLHAVLGLLLSRHSGSDDIIIGTPMANRLQPELDPLIGYFVNTLVLRTNTRSSNFLEYLNHVRAVNLDAQANQDIPFEQLVEQCQIKRSLEHTPVFQIMFTLSVQETDDATLAGLKFSKLNNDKKQAKFDLDITAKIIDGGLELSWVYDSSLFERSTIDKFDEHFCRLLTAVCRNPQAPLNELQMFSASEASYLLEELNSAKADVPSDMLLHEVFEAQVERFPKNIAVEFEGAAMTYSEINKLANQWAGYLRDQGVEREIMVGICMNRSIEMIVAILAVIKAGGAYVPLDPDYPQARLDYMLQDAQLQFIVTQSGLTNRLNLAAGMKVVAVDSPEFLEKSTCFSVDNLKLTVSQCPSDLAYMIYTSGSTGKPKGVLIEHRGVINMVVNQRSILKVTECSRVLQFASISFDAAVYEWAGALTNGATLCICGEKERKSPQNLQQFLSDNKVSMATIPPAVLKEMTPSDDLKLQSLIVAGETCEQQLADLWSGTCNMFNAYGPTEATVWASTAQLDPGREVTIGRGIANAKLYVFDSTKSLVPPGAIGELYIGGPGVARGYLNKQQLTEEKFINNPYRDDASERLYRTGDLVRYLPDGDLAFVGRVDEQVKLNGFRIELGEIKHQLSRCKGVSSCEIFIREVQGRKSLVAFVTSDIGEGPLCKETLAHELGKCMPEYMVPSAFIQLDKFPLTPNGKIDKKALQIQTEELPEVEFVAPQTETEKELLEIWARLLQLDSEQISAKASFFELGGHSLLAAKLVNHIRVQFGFESELVKIKDIFTHAVLTKQAEHIDLMLMHEKQERLRMSISEQETTEEGFF